MLVHPLYGAHGSQTLQNKGFGADGGKYLTLFNQIKSICLTLKHYKIRDFRGFGEKMFN